MKPLLRLFVTAFLIHEHQQSSLAVCNVPNLLLLRDFADFLDDCGDFIFCDFVKGPAPEFRIVIGREFCMATTVGVATRVGKENIVAFVPQAIR